MRDHAGARRHRRASERRPARDADRAELPPGKYTLTEALAPTAARAIHQRPLVGERPRHGFVPFDPIGVGSLGDDLEGQRDGEVADEAADLYQRARAAYEAGRFLEAGQLFEQAAAANRANRADAMANAALAYGRALREPGAGERPRPDMAALDESAGEPANPIRETAREDLEHGHRDDAAAARAPESTGELEYDAGMAQLRSGNHEAAVQSFRAALAGAPAPQQRRHERPQRGQPAGARSPARALQAPQVLRTAQAPQVLQAPQAPTTGDRGELGATGSGGRSPAETRAKTVDRGELGASGSDGPIGRGQVGATGSGGGGNSGERSQSESSEDGARERERSGPGGEVGDIRVRTAAPAPNGGHDRRTVGVGEHVTFTAQRSGTWTASAGEPTTGSGSSFRWVAPARPGAITISFSGGRAGGQQQRNQQQGSNTSISINVIAPSSVTFTKAAGLDGEYTGAGAGMDLRYRIGPGNVSWGAIHVKEIRTGSAANAVGVQGYFAEHFTPENLRHEATEAWEDIEDTNEPAAGRGDRAAIAPGAYLPEPWTNGQYGWVIPWSYRAQGDRSGEGHPFTTVVQNFRIEGPSGRVTVTKGEASHSRTPPPGIVEAAPDRPARMSTEEPVRNLDFGAVPAPER
jgi:hypothetical protein